MRRLLMWLFWAPSFYGPDRTPWYCRWCKRELGNYLGHEEGCPVGVIWG